MQALSAHNLWNSYVMDYEEPSKLVFSLREPKSRLLRNGSIKISTDTNGRNKDWGFEVKGSFIKRACTINDRRGNVVAQVISKPCMQKARNLININANNETESIVTCSSFSCFWAGGSHGNDGKQGFLPCGGATRL